jgi:hypothetical protein
MILIAFLLLSVSAQAKETPRLSPSHYRGPGISEDLNPTVPQTERFITPAKPVQPFYQWDGNNGYCGEVSIIQGAMNHGMWMSQYNARLICGTGLSQSGPDGFCAEHDDTANYNAQVLIEKPNPGDEIFASAELCLKNARLEFEQYDYSKQPKGMAGYRDYMSWVKSQVIQGHQVTVGVLDWGASDPQYDHEVTVNKIGTNHSPIDSTYYDDDVLYFEDHSSSDKSFTKGYTFKSLAQSRTGLFWAFQRYGILIPGGYPIYSQAGGDGFENNTHPVTAANYAFSVVGPEDPDHALLPVRLTVTGSSVGSKASKPSSFYGYDFEDPEVADCSNAPPKQWMSLSLQVEVTGLVPGESYNLYEYDFDGVPGIGDKAALAVPVSDFNAQAYLATNRTRFVATAARYTKTVEVTADKIVVFRAVPESGK